jgi:hypothetical protein
MQNITSTAGLKNEIRLLEYKQAYQGQLLKEQFNLVVDNLKPVNLLKRTFAEVTSSHDLFGNILSTTMSLTSDYLSKKRSAVSSMNKFKKLFGSIILFTVTKIIAKNPEVIKSFGLRIFNSIFSKKEK